MNREGRHIEVNSTTQDKDADTSPLLLDARTLADGSTQTTNITLKYFSINSSVAFSYTAPTSNLKQGGVIRIIGQPLIPIQVTLEGCVLDVNEVSVFPSGKTHGDILYGCFLRFFYIKKC
jgi:hypothetical protein